MVVGQISSCRNKDRRKKDWHGIRAIVIKIDQAVLKRKMKNGECNMYSEWGCGEKYDTNQYLVSIA